MTTTEILDKVMPYPTGCRSCGERRRALQRLNLTEWINANRHLSDEEIIGKLKKKVPHGNAGRANF